MTYVPPSQPSCTDMQTKIVFEVVPYVWMDMYYGGKRRGHSPGIGVTGGCEPPYGCWESNQIFYMVITTEPSL